MLAWKQPSKIKIKKQQWNYIRPSVEGCEWKKNQQER